jgi:hypothetical protein
MGPKSLGRLCLERLTSRLAQSSDSILNLKLMMLRLLRAVTERELHNVN